MFNTSKQDLVKFMKGYKRTEEDIIREFLLKLDKHHGRIGSLRGEDSHKLKTLHRGPELDT